MKFVRTERIGQLRFAKSEDNGVAPSVGTAAPPERFGDNVRGRPAGTTKATVVWQSARSSRVIRAALAVARSGAIVCCTVSPMVACGSPNQTVEGSAGPAHALVADSLIVGLDDVRRITGSSDLKSDARADDHQPHRRDVDAPGPCQVFNPQVAFGSGWTQFRSVVDNGFARPSPTGVVPPGATGPTATAPVTRRPLLVGQTVGVYPDAGAARNGFERLIPSLNECSALHAKHYGFVVNHPDASTATLNYGNGSSSIYRVKSSVLIYVEIAGFPQSEQIAGRVSQTIADRIN